MYQVQLYLVHAVNIIVLCYVLFDCVCISATSGLFYTERLANDYQRKNDTL
jgi:hypothetical protein